LHYNKARNFVLFYWQRICCQFFITLAVRMKHKAPKTKLEIELLCDKILLQQRVKQLQTHLQAALNALDETLKGKVREN